MIQLLNTDELLQVSGGALNPMTLTQMRADCLGAIRSSASMGGATGTGLGGLVGSVVPFLGTAAGAVIGGAVGALGSGAYAAKYNTSCVGIRVTRK